jgi:hypothetical protein
MSYMVIPFRNCTGMQKRPFASKLALVCLYQWLCCTVIHARFDSKTAKSKLNTHIVCGCDTRAQKPAHTHSLTTNKQTNRQTYTPDPQTLFAPEVVAKRFRFVSGFKRRQRVALGQKAFERIRKPCHKLATHMGTRCQCDGNVRSNPLLYRTKHDTKATTSTSSWRTVVHGHQDAIFKRGRYGIPRRTLIGHGLGCV